MRTVIGTIGATLAIVAFMAIPAGSAAARSHTDVYASAAPGGTKSFVGPADDAFFVDIAAAFDMCDPCGMDGGTGMELLFNAIIGPTAAGLGLDWEDDWFEDFESGDQRAGLFGLKFLSAELEMSDGQAVLVTSEPEGGSPQPTSNPVLAAALT